MNSKHNHLPPQQGVSKGSGCHPRVRIQFFSHLTSQVVALLAFVISVVASPAHAQNQLYEDIQLRHWDMDGDGTNDIALSLSGESVDWTGTKYAVQAFAYWMQFIDGYSGFVRKDPLGAEAWRPGDSVGPENTLGCSYGSLNLLFVEERYGVKANTYVFEPPQQQELVAGVRLQRLDGLHYGWIRIRPTGPLTTNWQGFPEISAANLDVRFAVHPEPNQSIVIGEPPVHLPSTSEETVRSYAGFVDRCRLITVRKRHLHRPDGSSSWVYSIAGDDFLVRPAPYPRSSMQREVVPWPGRTRLPIVPSPGQFWGDAAVDGLLLEERFDALGHPIEAFGPLASVQSVYLVIRDPLEKKPIWIQVDRALNVKAGGIAVAGAMVPSGAYQDDYLDIDSDGLLDLATYVKAGPGFGNPSFPCAPSIRVVMPIGDFRVSEPLRIGQRIDGNFTQLRPEGVDVSQNSTCLLGSWDFGYYFGLYRDAPDGRHLGWIQFPSWFYRVDDLIQWFEESPNAPATAGRYPAPELHVGSTMINSKKALEFEVKNLRERFHLEGRELLPNKAWKLYFTNVSTKFTIPIPTDDRPRVFRLVSAN